MKFIIIKEVKRSNGLWRFACGDVYNDTYLYEHWNTHTGVNTHKQEEKAPTYKHRAQWGDGKCDDTRAGGRSVLTIQPGAPPATHMHRPHDRGLTFKRGLALLN